MKYLTAVVCLVMTAGVAVWTHPVLSQQSPQQAPRFTAGVDLMRLELTVLDKRTRKPIRGLTADDFIVKVGGKPQVIEAFDEVRVPGRAAPLPRAFAEAATDVASNTVEQPRLFLIVMDDVFTDRDPRGNDPYTRVKGIDIANTVVDQLGPGDMAAVVFSQANTPAQDFTADRVALRRAIKTFTPRPVHPSMVSVLSLGVLERANNFLRQMPGYRRAMVWVTLGPGSVDLDQEDLMIWTGEPGQPVSLAANQINEAAATGAARVGAGGFMAPVPVYAYSLDGLKPVSVGETKGGSLPNPFGPEALQKVAVNTGGRVIHGTNAPDRAVPAMFEELSSYYTLAYRGNFPMDGRMRWLDVQVTGHDVLIAPSGTSFTTPRVMDGRLVMPSKTERPAGLLGALAGPLPRGDIRMTLAAVPLAVTGRREQLLALTVGVPTPEVGQEPLQYGLSVIVYDGEGRREILSQQLSMTTPPRRSDSEADARSEVAMPLALRPGRYAVRVAAQPVGSELAGSVYATIVVPDFAREPLSLSGLAVGRADGRPVGGREALSAWLPFAPTTTRTFATTDRVGALLRVYQGTGTPGQATITTDILNTDGQVVMSTVRSVPAAQFQPGVRVDHPYELPLRLLVAGEYLLRVTVVAGTNTAHREMRFTVR